MVSDFITMDGYLCLTEEEYAAAKVHNPDIKMGARQLLEYGEARDGYWTGDKFMKQMKKVVKVAETIYPKEKGYQLYWVFDQSGCHVAYIYAENALNVNRMNPKEGGCQPLMHDTTFEGKRISMTKMARNKTGEYVRVPRGMIDILKQRRRYHPRMKVEDMKKELASHSDFRDEKNQIVFSSPTRPFLSLSAKISLRNESN